MIINEFMDSTGIPNKTGLNLGHLTKHCPLRRGIFPIIDQRSGCLNLLHNEKWSLDGSW